VSEKRRITLKDIAKALDLSPSTVSRALNGYPSLSDETIRQVKEYAEEHNYIPNTLAANLRKNRTSILGMIVPEIVHHFFSTTISGAIESAKNQGYHVMVSQSGDTLEGEAFACRTMLGLGVDGLLISISNETVEGEHIQDFLDEGKPVVQFDKITDHLPTPKVVVDNFDGAYNAVTHLIRQGYRKIAHLSGRMEVKNAHQRYLGYRKALDDHGLVYLEEWVKKCREISEKEGFDFTKELMESTYPPDAIFCINDLVALGCMKSLKTLGYSLPDQIGLMGFSNWLLSDYTTPSLSSVNQHGYEMGAQTAELLIDLIKNQELGENKSLILKTELVVRRSSMR
jgi:LacI family transcriptional regulator